MRRFWFLLSSAAGVTVFGTCPTAAAEPCLHGIYIDPTDFKAYACPWGGGTLHTAHGDVYVDAGGIVLPDSAFAYGLPDDGNGGGDDDGADDSGTEADSGD